MAKYKNFNFQAYHSFSNAQRCITVVKSGPPEFISMFIPVTGMKFSYGKVFSPLTEISGTEPARPLI